MNSPVNFELQFPTTQIKELATRYQYDDDAEALDAGRRIKCGECSRSNLEIIFRWKTRGRGIGRLEGNSEDEIADALRLAVQAKTERAAISVLCGLFGVEIPVASAILTAIDPERYTIIDVRALQSLGVDDDPKTVDYYLEYLKHCRELAGQNSVSLRDLDRALWQWSKEQPSPLKVLKDKLARGEITWEDLHK